MPRHPEYQYLDLLENILENGDYRMDRTGVGTKSIFGAMMRFNVSDGTVPILTTKRVYWKTAVKEMLWFLTGQTNIQSLLRENVKIWTDWPLAKYRKATGEDISQGEFEARILADDAFAMKWGELRVYGSQWRKWKGPDGKEHDQIATLIETLKTNPASRRMLFHAWNVAELDEMALPPCHLLYQFHVSNTKVIDPNDGKLKPKLSAMLTARSQDIFLGTPFNLVGISSLLLMIAQQADMMPGDIIWSGGDVHIYSNHDAMVREMSLREPRPFPTMRLLRKPDSIDGYRIEDFEVTEYNPHPVISAPVAV